MARGPDTWQYLSEHAALLTCAILDMPGTKDERRGNAAYVI